MPPLVRATRPPSGACLAAALLLSGCSERAMLQRIVPPEHDRFARTYIETVRSGDIEGAVRVLSPALAQLPSVRDSLASVVRQLPAGPIDSLRLIGANRISTRGVERTQLTYELHTRDGWGLAAVSVIEELKSRYVEGFHARRIPGALEELNAFTLRGKGPAHLLVLLVAAACAAVSLASAVIAVRTPMRGRWLWGLVALLGVTRLIFNWNTGATVTQIPAIQFFSAGVIREGFVGPWSVIVSFPLGAVLALGRVQQFRRARRGPTSLADGEVGPSPPAA